MTQVSKSSTAGRTGWWREPMMWLVVGGPALVVVASFITLTLAVKHPDPVLSGGAEDASSSNQAADFRTGSTPSNAHIPALQARNHAATGGR